MIIRTSKLLDFQLIELIRALLNDYGGKVHLTTPLNRTDVYTAEDIEDYPLETDSRIIESFSYHFSPDANSEFIIFSRGIVDPIQLSQHRGQPHAAFSYRIPSAYFDEFGFFAHNNGNATLNPGQRANIAKRLQEFSVESDIGSDEEAKKSSRLVSAQINALSKLHIKMTSGLVDAQKKLEDAFADREAEQSRAFTKRLEELEEKERALSRRAEELNDREPQHERRRLREHLTKNLKDSLVSGTSSSERNLYRSYVSYFLIGMLFVYLSYIWATTGYQLSGEKFWVVSIKSIAAGIGAAAFFWAGVTGYRNAAAARIEYENSVNRYAFDMDRASWIVETMLQMNASEGSKIPQEWLDAVCRDLFVIRDNAKEDNRSLEAFAALFDATAKARIGTNGIDFEIDRKGARRLAEGE